MTSIKQYATAFIDLCAILCTLIVVCLSVGGFFSEWHWRLAWYSHPRPHFLLAGLVAFGWFVWRKSWAMSAVAAVIITVNTIVLVPFFIAPSTTVETAPTLTIAHLNTNRGQADLSTLSELTADILFLQEVTPELNAELPTLLDQYEVVFTHPLSNTHGSALLAHKNSSLQIENPRIIYLPDDSVRPLITAETSLDNIPIQLLSLHIIRPHHEWADNYQQVELAAAASWSRNIQQQQGAEVVMIGDFNVTPWAQRFSTLLSEGKLNDSLRGYGLQNSWPANLPLMFGLPIDHAVHSDGLLTIGRSTLTTSHTDHALIQVVLTPNMNFVHSDG